MGPEERALFEKQMADQERRTKIAEDEKNALLLERRKLKGMVAAQKRGNAKSGGKKRGGRSKKAKKDFASVALEDDGNSIQQADLDVVAAAQKTHSRQQSFQRHISSDGHVYFSNTDTQETVWELPEGAIVV